MSFTLANENNTGESTANPKTGTITTGGTGTNTQLVVLYVVLNGTPLATDTVTLAGNLMTQAGTYESTTEGVIGMWYYIGDLGVSNTLAISAQNRFGRNMSFMASSWNVATNKTAEFGFTNQASSTGSTNPNVLVSFPAGPSIVVSGLFTGATSVNGLTAFWNLLAKYDTGNEGQAHQYYLNEKEASNVNMAWTFSTSDDWATIGGSFQEIASGGSGDLISMDTVAFDDMILVNGVSMSNIVSINGVLTGN